ncbi:hypothetical protein LTR78_010030 [Recurvomyces mirabilis]|uniref:BTB domain-containing protein n=1 Tax=Recurvomyces mirabilis TaxID=574656 RepID=A0AAE0WI84_9PEZI|nr:hypothetical protein LTR78_010030 [Recurvomyces mirabilis]KAK5149811.1 hypothetical protein LTS14_010632 [Recurvomyces mirabilis]
MATISLGQASPTRPLCFDDGDVVVQLGEDVKKHLLIHKHILKVAMPPLAAAVGRWSGAVTITHPQTMKDVTVHSLVLELKDTVYELVAKKPDLDPGISSLFAAAQIVNGENEGGSEDDIPPAAIRIHQHEILGAGLPTRTETRTSTPGYHTHDNAQESLTQSHAVTPLYTLFGMVYKTVDPTMLAEHTTYEGLADLVEYAEVYMCLHLVADQIRTCLLAKLDLWQDVKQQPLFHLALAIRLRCEETFADSLRHLAGRGTHYSHLVEAGLDEGEAAALTNRTRPDLPVGTTFVASSWDIGKTAQEKAEWLAKCAYRDWFDQALAGEPHSPHIRKCKYAYSDLSITADFQPMTLRRVLEKIDLAAKTNSRRAPLEYDTAERLVGEFNLEEGADISSTHIIEQTIARLNRSVARIAAPYLGGPQVTIASDRPTHDTYTQRCAAGRHGGQGEDTCSNAQESMSRDRGGLGEQDHAAIAKDDKGCCYFTYFTILDEQIPWRSEPAWEPFHLHGLKLASQEWLKAVGIAGTGEEQDESTEATTFQPRGGPEA